MVSTEAIGIIVTLAIGIIAAVFAWFSFRKDHRRRRKEATITFFHQIQTEGANIIKEFDPKYYKKKHKTDKDAAEAFLKELNDNNNTSKLENATQLLSTLERFSVGINTGVFDLNVVGRMADVWLIRMYEWFSPYIEQRRASKPRGDSKSYIEFETVYNDLKEMEEKHKFFCEKVEKKAKRRITRAAQKKKTQITRKNRV